jgi:hypothetical protein
VAWRVLQLEDGERGEEGRPIDEESRGEVELIEEGGSGDTPIQIPARQWRSGHRRGQMVTRGEGEDTCASGVEGDRVGKPYVRQRGPIL